MMGHTSGGALFFEGRLLFRRLTERYLPNLVVLAYGELMPDIEVKSVGTVMLK